MLKILVSAFFTFHGLVHLIGFFVNWKIISVETMPYATSVLAHKIEVGATGIRIIGLLWVVAAGLWIVAGVGLMALAPWWLAMTVVALLFSTVMCILGWPDARYGLLINLIIVVFLFLNGRYDWLPMP